MVTSILEADLALLDLEAQASHAYHFWLLEEHPYGWNPPGSLVAIYCIR